MMRSAEENLIIAIQLMTLLTITFPNRAKELAEKAFANRHSNDQALMGMLTSKEDVINAAALVRILTRSLLLQERRAPGSIMAKPLPKG